MSYIALRNWRKFQHYTDRRPPWVKLHVEILDNAELAALPPAAQLVFYKLIVIASKHDNRIPDSQRILAGSLQLPTKTVTTSIKHLERIGLLDVRYETESEIEMAQRGQLPLIPASDPRATDEASASTHARPRARTEAKAETQELPSSAAFNGDHARAPADDRTALPGFAHPQTPLEELIDACGARDIPSEGVIRAIAAKMPEHVHARALESFLGRTPRPDEPIAYAIGCLKSIAADTGRQTPRIGPRPEPEF